MRQKHERGKNKKFSITTDLTFDEFYQYALQVVNKYCLSLTIITSAFIFAVGTVAGIILQRTLTEVAFWELVIIIGCSIYYRISYRKSVKKQYDEYCKNGELDTKITISFYDNYLVEETNHIIKKLSIRK